MGRTLLWQAAFVPFVSMMAIMVWSLFVPGYSSMVQHMSELQLLQHPIAQVTRVVPIALGLSIVGFGIALLGRRGSWMPFTAVTAIIFGAANTSNGIFASGDPRHGLYGLAMFFILVPACFAAELPRREDNGRVIAVSLATALFLLAYTWLQFSGLDPHGFRGATQRFAVMVLVGWYTFAALVLLRLRSTTYQPSDEAAMAATR